MNKRSKSLKVLDFKIGLMFAIVFASSFFLLLYFPQVPPELAVSSKNFLGIVTSIFVHKDFCHFGINLVVAVVTILFYSFSSFISGIRNDKFMVGAIWLSAIIANLAFVFISPDLSVGSSGLVSAFMGGATTFALINAWKAPDGHIKKIQIIIGVLLFVVFVFLNFFSSTDTNNVVHWIAFFTMVSIVLLKQLWSERSSKAH